MICDIQHDCVDRVLRCTFGCGATMKREAMVVHVVTDCPKRETVCDLCNDKELKLW